MGIHPISRRRVLRAKVGFRHMPKTLSDSELAEIHTHIVAHRKIQAIKLYREASGEGLKEAKDAVEAMTAELRVSSADRFAPKREGGCTPVLVFAFFACVGIGIIVRAIGCAAGDPPGRAPARSPAPEVAKATPPAPSPATSATAAAPATNPATRV